MPMAWVAGCLLNNKNHGEKKEAHNKIEGWVGVLGFALVALSKFFPLCMLNYYAFIKNIIQCKMKVWWGAPS